MTIDGIGGERANLPFGPGRWASRYLRAHVSTSGVHMDCLSLSHLWNQRAGAASTQDVCVKLLLEYSKVGALQGSAFQMFKSHWLSTLIQITPGTLCPPHILLVALPPHGKTDVDKQDDSNNRVKLLQVSGSNLFILH